MGLDHGKVTVNLISREQNKRKSITFTVIGGTDNFVEHYGLIDSKTTRKSKMELTITIKGDHVNQTKHYVSNNHELIEAVEKQDHSKLKVIFL